MIDERRRAAWPPALAEIARLAGRAIMQVYATPFDVRAKADRSPVTDADEAAEEIILAALAELDPAIPVIAEERVAKGLAPPLAARAEGPFWLVDPLDGTSEFVSRNGEFTVNIALVENRRPSLGVIHLPVGDITYTGAGPGRAFRAEAGGKPAPIAARRAPAEGCVALVSRSHLHPGDEAWLAKFPVRRRAVSGSSLKFARLAEGAADIYPRFGPTMEWDTAAGQAVLVAAGGSVRAPDGSELLYAKPDFRNGGFIARGRD
jgi:3'(2'), 5'-bisphosphate nucleotidase